MGNGDWRRDSGRGGNVGTSGKDVQADSSSIYHLILYPYVATMSPMYSAPTMSASSRLLSHYSCRRYSLSTSKSIDANGVLDDQYSGLACTLPRASSRRVMKHAKANA